ncbi:aspartate ammonia-lyase [Candidatus Peregrinibacteria bacterium CG11_big_fil_rev_8_21_14_0_20_41_10]|nr:MAG: aspartate ammonia-lyase [Candidatus Peregrinibacteria bacterium CG11_big_fil_rev_8_21_14_0_20_41_10]PJC38308.1 MAG: aspartate ammonia-lyase [Candidatus Peregrinibacteria bacterium CG_4_9_14_0_2_um_filter_41_14]
MQSGNTRIENDSMGAVSVPVDAYYGAFTVRAGENFQISGQQMPVSFERALGQVKLASAEANHELGHLTKDVFEGIKKACDEFIAGMYSDAFLIDIYQAGAGTSVNMNANEIIANRANELLGGGKGDYTYVNPNNDVNMSQSTNDVIPVTSRLAILQQLPLLLKALTHAYETTDRFAQKNQDIVKVGRTHLQDAVPITVGQAFDSYSQALKKTKLNLETLSTELYEIGLGGTAVGTGINTHPQYQTTVTTKLSKLTGIPFTASKNNTEMANNMTAFLNFSSGLRALASNLINYSEDLKLMAMGPKAGINEVLLPTVQPGSSIMPGKVNPSILECLDMICFRVLGNDQIVNLASHRSHFELNVYCPIIATSILESMQILTNGLEMFAKKCLQDLHLNQEIVETTFEKSLAVGTALAPHLGYLKTAEVIKKALAGGNSIREQVLSEGLLTEEDLDIILDVARLTRPTRQ